MNVCVVGKKKVWENKERKKKKGRKGKKKKKKRFERGVIRRAF